MRLLPGRHALVVVTGQVRGDRPVARGPRDRARRSRPGARRPHPRLARRPRGLTRRPPRHLADAPQGSPPPTADRVRRPPRRCLATFAGALAHLLSRDVAGSRSPTRHRSATNTAATVERHELHPPDPRTPSATKSLARGRSCRADTTALPRCRDLGTPKLPTCRSSTSTLSKWRRRLRWCGLRSRPPSTDVPGVGSGRLRRVHRLHPPCRPPVPGPFGPAVDPGVRRRVRAPPPSRLVLAGAHRFSTYELAFAIEPIDPQGTADSQPRAMFPGRAGGASGCCDRTRRPPRRMRRLIRAIQQAAERTAPSSDLGEAGTAIHDRSRLAERSTRPGWGRMVVARAIVLRTPVRYAVSVRDRGTIGPRIESVRRHDRPPDPEGDLLYPARRPRCRSRPTRRLTGHGERQGVQAAARVDEMMVRCMHRTNLYLTHEQERALDARAQAMGMSRSARWCARSSTPSCPGLPPTIPRCWRRWLRSPTDTRTRWQGCSTTTPTSGSNGDHRRRPAMSRRCRRLVSTGRTLWPRRGASTTGCCGRSLMHV